jgi:Flp pilus assembly pilin Flp
MTTECLTRFLRDDRGQDLVEYALLVAFIALACVMGQRHLGAMIREKYMADTQAVSVAS